MATLEELASEAAQEIHFLTIREPSGATREEHRNELIDWFVSMMHEEFE